MIIAQLVRIHTHEYKDNELVGMQMCRGLQLSAGQRRGGARERQMRLTGQLLLVCACTLPVSSHAGWSGGLQRGDQRFKDSLRPPVKALINASHCCLVLPAGRSFGLRTNQTRRSR